MCPQRDACGTRTNNTYSATCVSFATGINCQGGSNTSSTQHRRENSGLRDSRNDVKHINGPQKTSLEQMSTAAKSQTSGSFLLKLARPAETTLSAVCSLPVIYFPSTPGSTHKPSKPISSTGYSIRVRRVVPSDQGWRTQTKHTRPFWNMENVNER